MDGLKPGKTKSEREAEAEKLRGEECVYAPHGYCVTHDAWAGTCNVDQELVAKKARAREVARLRDDIRYAEAQLRALGK